jgi:hypothetical protein
MADGTQARDDFAKLQTKIKKQWHNFATSTGREAYEDLMQYIDSQREMLIHFAEELEMPSPDGKGMATIPQETAATFLQTTRGLRIVKTYIQNRIDADVAQSQKTK